MNDDDKVLLAVDLRAMVDRRTSIPDVEDAINTAIGKMGKVVFLTVKLVTPEEKRRS